MGEVADFCTNFGGSFLRALAISQKAAGGGGGGGGGRAHTCHVKLLRLCPAPPPFRLPHPPLAPLTR